MIYTSPEKASVAKMTFIGHKDISIDTIWQIIIWINISNYLRILHHFQDMPHINWKSQFFLLYLYLMIQLILSVFH